MILTIIHINNTHINEYTSSKKYIKECFNHRIKHDYLYIINNDKLISFLEYTINGDILEIEFIRSNSDIPFSKLISKYIKYISKNLKNFSNIKTIITRCNSEFGKDYGTMFKTANFDLIDQYKEIKFVNEYNVEHVKLCNDNIKIILRNMLKYKNIYLNGEYIYEYNLDKKYRKKRDKDWKNMMNISKIPYKKINKKELIDKIIEL